MKHIIYVMGATCCGKSTLVEKAAELYPDTVGIVQVGKELRKRHPPEYFQGLGAMDHTEGEVKEILLTQVSQHFQAGKQIVLVDGNPRSIDQLSHVSNLRNQVAAADGGSVGESFWWLDAMEENIEEWKDERFRKDPDGRALAEARMRNDRIQLYPLLHRLHYLDMSVEYFLILPVFNYAKFFERQGFPNEP